MAHDKRRRRRRKGDPRPPKPYKAFPLTAHAAGYWCKSIRGRIHYFGAWGHRVNGKLIAFEDGGRWKEALELYKSQADALHAGRTPRPQTDELTVADLCNHFLTSKQRLLNAGEIAPRTFADYKRICVRLVDHFGNDRLVDDLRSSDFERLRASIAKTCGPTRLGGEVQQTRMVFKFGFDAGLIDKPVRYGPTFKKPSKKVLRKHKARNGQKLFDADAVRKLLDGTSDDGEKKQVPGAKPQLKAMILLAINCGFGNADCGTLPLSAVDLDAGWIDFPRPKTGIARRCPTWPETVEALRDVIENRPTPKSNADADLVFVTKYGQSWAKDTAAAPISAEFRKQAQAVDVYRQGIGFYALRHTFRTVADATRDFPAIDLIMGHARDDMASVYRERIDDDRLVAVTDYVRSWLFGEDVEGDDEDEADEQPMLKLVG